MKDFFYLVFSLFFLYFCSDTNLQRYLFFSFLLFLSSPFSLPPFFSSFSSSFSLFFLFISLSPFFFSFLFSLFSLFSSIFFNFSYQNRVPKLSFFFPPSFFPLIIQFYNFLSTIFISPLITN